MYTKDQLKAIDTILNKRSEYMNCARQLLSDGRSVVLSDTTLLVLKKPIWKTGTEYDVGNLISSNETRDIERVFSVSTKRTHYDYRNDFCKLAEDAFFDSKVLKRAFRAMKYRDEEVMLHYEIDQRTLQRYCGCLTFRTEYGYALVLAVRVRDESALSKVGR